MLGNMGKRNIGANVPSLGELQVLQHHWSVGHKQGERGVRNDTGEVRKDEVMEDYQCQAKYLVLI